MIIDPHIHLWDPASTPRPASAFVKLFGWSPRLLDVMAPMVLPRATRDFIGHHRHLSSPYLPAIYGQDTGRHEVEGYVYVQAGWEGRGKLALADETAWVEQVAAEAPPSAPKLLGIVGAADLRVPHLDELLEAHKRASARFKGVRDMLSWSPKRGVMSFAHAPDLLGDSAWRRGFASLANHGLSFDAWCYLDQAEGLVDLFESHPEVPVALCHLATPMGAGGPFAGVGQSESERRDIEARWRKIIERLADFDHVSAKISGLTMPILGWDYHKRESLPGKDEVRVALSPFVEHAIESFGVDRCMFASNFPMDKVSLPFETLYDAFEEIVSGFSEAERRKLFRDNAARFYRIST